MLTERMQQQVERLLDEADKTINASAQTVRRLR